MGGTRWPALAMVGRHELRRRWRAVVALGLLAGVVGAVVLGALQLTGRTASAPARLTEATALDDVRVVLFGPQVPTEDVLALPGVRESRVLNGGVGRLTSAQAVTFSSVSAGTWDSDLLSPVVVSGRAADPDVVEEVVVGEEYATHFGLGPGDRLPFAFLTYEEVGQFETGFGEPDGPTVELRVTGVVRLTREMAGGMGLAPVLAGPAFAERYAETLPLRTVLLRLDEPGAAATAELEQQVQQRFGSIPPLPGFEEFPVAAAEVPQHDGGPAVRSARSVLVAGLVVLVGITAVSGLLAVGQGLARHAGGTAAAQRVEAALGLTTTERAVARAVPALLGAVVAAAVAAGGALLSARLEPLGALSVYEPQPGWLPDPLLVGVGAAAVAGAFLLGAVVAASRVLRVGQAGRATSPRRVPALLARRAPLLAGTAFVATRGRAGGRGPAGAALASAALGVAGIVAAATFAASLDRLEDTPARYGWVGDFAWVDAQPEQVEQVAAHPEVVGLATVRATGAVVEGADVSAYAADVVEGGAPWVVLAGREPQADDEVALGQRIATRLAVEVGDTVTLTTPAGPRPASVVGRVITPAFSGESFGSVAVFTAEGLAAAQAFQPFTSAIVTTTTPEAGDALAAELSSQLELEQPGPPREVRNLLDLGRLPDLLAGFLVALSLAVLGHALAVTVRRRAPDLAVLRVIGFTPRQVGTALVHTAATTAVVGVVVGVPLGLGVGRVVWREVADEIGVAGDIALPWTVLGLLPVAAVLVALLVALLPARRAAAVSPATVLRAE